MELDGGVARMGDKHRGAGMAARRWWRLWQEVAWLRSIGQWCMRVKEVVMARHE